MDCQLRCCFWPEFPKAGVAGFGGRVRRTVIVIGEQVLAEPSAGPGPCSIASSDLRVLVLEERGSSRVEERPGKSGHGGRRRVHVIQGGLSLGLEWEAQEAGRGQSAAHGHSPEGFADGWVQSSRGNGGAGEQLISGCEGNGQAVAHPSFSGSLDPSLVSHHHYPRL